MGGPETPHDIVYRLACRRIPPDGQTIDKKAKVLSDFRMAASVDNEETIIAFLQQGVSLNTSNRFVKTTLMNGKEAGLYPYFKATGRSRQQYKCQGQRGPTSLILAISEGSPIDAGTLPTLGADPGIQDENGLSALMEAARVGIAQPIITLLKHGANSHLKDARGEKEKDFAIKKRSRANCFPTGQCTKDKIDWITDVQITW